MLFTVTDVGSYFFAPNIIFGVDMCNWHAFPKTGLPCSSEVNTDHTDIVLASVHITAFKYMYVYESTNVIVGCFF